MATLIPLLWAVTGALLASLLALLPGLHVYTVAGLIILGWTSLEEIVPPDLLAFFFVGMTTAYAMVNSIPSIFLSAPDDSTVFVVLPGQKYLLQQRGYEATVLTGLGGLGGIAILALLTPIAPSALPVLRAILQPHLPWILWAVIAYMLMSEWPKGWDRAPAGWRRWWDGWRSLAAGLITFLLAGLLGLILFYRSPLPVEAAHQGLLPAFTGLFAVPWILQSVISGVELPEQDIASTVDSTPEMLVRGTLAGALGGLFAAFFPVVTGGIGSMIAGHATAQRDDRLFLISQGASKVIYYVGSLLFFFVPGLHMTRGGMAWMLSSLWSAHTPQTYYLAVATVVFTGALSFLLLLPAAHAAAKLVSRVDTRWIGLGTLVALLGVVTGTTGWGGLLMCVVATGIGLIPVLWGSRRMNCMGVLLLPIALNMTEVGGVVAGWLGLL